MSSTEENKAQFRRLYEEVLNQGDVSVVDELIAPDFFNHAAPPTTNRGPSSLRWLATMLRTAFPDGLPRPALHDRGVGCRGGHRSGALDHERHP